MTSVCFKCVNLIICRYFRLKWRLTRAVEKNTLWLNHWRVLFCCRGANAHGPGGEMEKWIAHAGVMIMMTVKITQVINRGKHSQEPLWHRLSVAGRRRNQQPTLGGTSTAALKYSCVSLSSFPYVNEPGEPQGWRAPRWPGEAANFCWTKRPTLSRWSSSRSRNDDFWCFLHLKGSERCLTSRLEDPLV